MEIHNDHPLTHETNWASEANDTSKEPYEQLLLPIVKPAKLTINTGIVTIELTENMANNVILEGESLNRTIQLELGSYSISATIVIKNLPKDVT